MTNWVRHSETHANTSTDPQAVSYKHQAQQQEQHSDPEQAACKERALREGDHGISGGDGVTLGKASRGSTQHTQPSG